MGDKIFAIISKVPELFSILTAVISPISEAEIAKVDLSPSTAPYKKVSNIGTPL